MIRMSDTYLLVDIDKIKRNINKIRNIGEKTMFAAVIKANAYGLGALTIAKEIENDVDYFTVARFSEAKQLRENHIKKPILILGYVALEDINNCVEYDIEIPIYDLDYSMKINSILNKKTIKAHLALDTGHGRIGFREYEIDKIKKLKELNNIDIISAFSHFSTADEKDLSYTNLQNDRFNNIINCTRELFNYKFVHISNDAGAIKHSITQDMIRSGISMYGIYPSNLLKDEKNIELEQSFELRSTISFVKYINEGEYVSYGRTFQASKKTKVATITIGYADGYSRLFSNLGFVKIKNNLCRVIGRVCMDQMMVDISGLDVEIGDEVIIYPDIYKEADKIGTIVYELMTSIDMRIPRIYIKDGQMYKNINYIGEINEN